METFKRELYLMFINQSTRLNIMRYFAYLGFSYLAFLIALLLSFVASMVPVLGIVFFIIAGLVMAVMIILNIIWTIRRLHDINFSGYWILAPLIPFTIAIIIAMLPFADDSMVWAVIVITCMIISAIAQLAIFILTLIPGTKGINRFGDVPEANNGFTLTFMIVFVVLTLLIAVLNALQPDNVDHNGRSTQPAVTVQ